MFYRVGSSLVEVLDSTDAEEITNFAKSRSWNDLSIDIIVFWHLDPHLLKDKLLLISDSFNIIISYPLESSHFYEFKSSNCFSSVCRGRLRGESMLVLYHQTFNRIAFYLSGDEDVDISPLINFNQYNFPYDIITFKKLDLVWNILSKMPSVEVRGAKPGYIEHSKSTLHRQFSYNLKSDKSKIVELNAIHNHYMGFDYPIKVAQNTANEYEFLNYNPTSKFFIKRFLWGELLSILRVFKQTTFQYSMLFISLRMVSFFSAVYSCLYLRYNLSEHESLDLKR